MDALLYFDFYATKPNLFIKKQDSIKTFLGTILSIFTLILLTLIFIFIIYCFINDTGLTVLYEKSSKGLGSLDLNLSKNIFFYRLNDKKGQKISPRIIKTYPYLTISTSNGTRYELLKENYCDVNKLVNEDKEYKDLINFDISSYYCVTYNNNEDAILQRRTNPFKNSYINLFIAKCQNDTNNNINDCASEEEIDEFIENNSIYVSLFLESGAIDHNNYTYPLTKKYYQNSMSIPKDFIFSYTFYWRKTDYLTRNSLIFFNYLFQKSNFILDATIKEKDIYSKNTNFYVDKTIGRIQFLITVEYIDLFIRKYLTLIDSLTIFISAFNIITKVCWFLNYLFTKSIIYCSIFEPFMFNLSNTFYESFESNINLRSNLYQSPNPSCSKLQLSQNKQGDISVLKLNNKSNNSLNKSIFNASSLAPKKSLELYRNDKIKNILNDIQKKKINPKISFIDNFLFFFAKIFNFNNQKQLYLQKLEKLLHDELSIDYLFFEFKKLKLAAYKDMNIIDLDRKFLNPSKSTKGQSIHASSLNFK